MGIPQNKAYEHRIIQTAQMYSGLSAGLLKPFQGIEDLRSLPELCDSYRHYVLQK